MSGLGVVGGPEEVRPCPFVVSAVRPDDLGRHAEVVREEQGPDESQRAFIRPFVGAISADDPDVGGAPDLPAQLLPSACSVAQLPGPSGDDR